LRLRGGWALGGSLPGDWLWGLALVGIQLDHACRTALDNWAERHSTAGPDAIRLHDLPERPGAGRVRAPAG
ncbi:hypothetical protein ACFW2N_28130, partial [Streptomyces sp. NPDC058855]